MAQHTAALWFALLSRCVWAGMSSSPTKLHLADLLQCLLTAVISSSSSGSKKRSEMQPNVPRLTALPVGTFKDKISTSCATPDELRPEMLHLADLLQRLQVVPLQ